MAQKTNLEIGAEVWYESWDSMCSGRVVEFDDEKHPGRVKVEGTRSDNGTQWVKKDDCYASEEDLADAIQEKSDKRVNEFLEQIKNVDDLVQFMFDNTVSMAEEYTDLDARKAAQIAADNLLNQDLLDRLTEKEQNEVFLHVRFQQVLDDVHSRAYDHGEFLTDSMADYAARKYVYEGTYDNTVSYWENIDSLIELSKKQEKSTESTLTLTEDDLQGLSENDGLNL